MSGSKFNRYQHHFLLAGMLLVAMIFFLFPTLPADAHSALEKTYPEAARTRCLGMLLRRKKEQMRSILKYRDYFILPWMKFLPSPLQKDCRKAIRPLAGIHRPFDAVWRNVVFCHNCEG